MMLLLMVAELTDMAVIMIERQEFIIAIKKRELNCSLNFLDDQLFFCFQIVVYVIYLFIYAIPMYSSNAADITAFIMAIRHVVV